MNPETSFIHLEGSPSAELSQHAGSCSARYVSYVQPSALISDSLDQIMKNHTLVRTTDEANVDWALCDSQVEA